VGWKTTKNSNHGESVGECFEQWGGWKDLAGGVKTIDEKQRAWGGGGPIKYREKVQVCIVGRGARDGLCQLNHQKPKQCRLETCVCVVVDIVEKHRGRWSGGRQHRKGPAQAQFDQPETITLLKKNMSPPNRATTGGAKLGSSCVRGENMGLTTSSGPLHRHGGGGW